SYGGWGGRWPFHCHLASVYLQDCRCTEQASYNFLPISNIQDKMSIQGSRNCCQACAHSAIPSASAAVFDTIHLFLSAFLCDCASSCDRSISWTHRKYLCDAGLAVSCSRSDSYHLVDWQIPLHSDAVGRCDYGEYCKEE
ncbi:hypothetical protein PENTCL1PPCAC_15557, partial [Pristionchus entomophagus]